LFQSAFRDQSIDFATKVESEFKNRAQRHDRGVKEAGFLVLWKTTMPAVLIETGFVSNPTEEKFLMSEQGQDYLASAIYRAFKAYKKEMEGDNYEEPVEKPAVKTTGKQDDKSGKKDVKNDSVKVAGNESKAGKKQVEKAKLEIVFGVQFATSKNKKPASSASFKNLENVWSYYHSGYYKYVSGRYANLNQAVDHLKIVRSKGFSDAFVVAFKGRERISPKEAMKIINANQGKN
jgi:N-acetylmuramoyl-L-alanine amidase